MTGRKAPAAPGGGDFAVGKKVASFRDCSQCWGKPLGEAISCGDRLCPAWEKGLLLLPFYWQELPEDEF